MQNKNSNNQKKVQTLLNSEFLTEPTRIALQKRFEKVGGNRFFDNDSFELLSVVCDLLMDQDSENRLVEIAQFIDERLYNNDSDGWRYDIMPPDGIMFKLGLQAIDETASQLFGQKFRAIQKEQQIQFLDAIQQGNVENEIWKKLNPKLFFEELLAETAEIFFSHPAVQASINYVGMADAKGWTKIKLNQTENLETNKDSFNN